MSYLVLARKWRPQKFRDLVGQSHITKTLLNAVRHERLAHAFLFTGPRGVGKTSTARILAKALRCESRVDGEPCNQCKTCVEITEGRAIDVQEIDGASNNGVDAIRELRENLTYLPASGKYKVYIIDEVHMLSGSAFNAFLKTLEEPPAHVYFIFATTEPHKIPITIHSRCQRYDFKRVPVPQVVEFLMVVTNAEQIVISPRSLGLIGRESEGCLRDALSLLDQVYAYAGKEISDQQVAEVLGVVDSTYPIELLRAVLKRDAKRALELIRQVYDAGHDLNQVMQALLEACRNVAVIVAAPEYELDELSDAERQEFRMLSTEITPLQAQEWFRYLVRAQGELSRAQFPRQMFEMAIFRLMMVEKMVPIDEWVQKLNELEERIAVGAPSYQQMSVQEAEAPVPIMPPATMDAGGAGEQWKQFINEIKHAKPLLATILEEGFLVSLSDQEIVVGYEEGSFCSRQLSDVDHKKHFEQFAKKFFGRSLQIKVRSVPLEEIDGRGHLRATAPQKEKIEGPDPLLEEAKRIFRGEFISKPTEGRAR
ncbi:MAG TPA: DNA polymerase III subunit gamma/tau [Bdellovibrionota bacterium]|nr:DNA polymerase III subunit gamma/tau [Bdellovibrionota bacterium]